MIFARNAEHVQAFEEEDAIGNISSNKGPLFSVNDFERVHSISFDIRKEKRNV